MWPVKIGCQIVPMGTIVRWRNRLTGKRRSGVLADSKFFLIFLPPHTGLPWRWVCHGAARCGCIP